MKRFFRYGSNDGGKTMHFDFEVHEKLKTIGKNLNLRTHLVSKSKTEMALCGDIEVHQITHNDEKVLYLLDLARVFPPAGSLSNISGGIFYRMLRPEIVHKHNKSLSSDAFSGWQQFDPQSCEMDDDVKIATQYLEQEVEKFAKILSNESVNKSIIESSLNTTKSPNFSSLLPQENIIRELHVRGINIRYIGLLVVKMEKQNQQMIQFLTWIMVSRSLKNMWRSEIRSSKDNGQRIHKVCLCVIIPMKISFDSLFDMDHGVKIIEKHVEK